MCSLELFILLVLEYLFLLLLLLYIYDHRTSMSLFVNLLALILISLGFLHDSLEGINSLSHSHVESCFYKVEVVVQELSETNEKCDRLVEIRFGVIFKQSELDDSISEFFLLQRGELLSESRGIVGIMINNGRRLLNVLSGVHEFKEENSSKSLVFLVVKVETEGYCDFRRCHLDPVTLIIPVVNFTAVSRVSIFSLNSFKSSPYRGSNEISLEFRELGGDILSCFHSLLFHFFVACPNCVLLGLAHGFLKFLSLRQLGDIDS